MRRSTLSAAFVAALSTAVLGLSTPLANAAPSDSGPPCSTHADALTPVICLPTDFGEDTRAPLADGQPIDFAAQVVNNGPAVANANIVLTVPDTIKLAPGTTIDRIDGFGTDEESDGTPLSCVVSGGGNTVTCATGPLASGTNSLIAISLQPTAKRKVGAQATFGVALQPSSPSSPFPRTAVSATVFFTGTAKLDLSLTPMSARVVVGRTATLIATVHNAGPDPAPGSVLIGFSSSKMSQNGDSHFVITNSQDPTGLDSGSASASAPASAPGSASESPGSASASSSGLAAKQAAAGTTATTKPVPAASATVATVRINAGKATVVVGQKAATNTGYWALGTIAAGKSVATEIIVRAMSPGVDTLLVLTASEAGGNCDLETADDITGCPSVATAALVAVAAPPAPTPTITTTETKTKTNMETATVTTTATPSSSAGVISTPTSSSTVPPRQSPVLDSPIPAVPLDPCRCGACSRWCPAPP